MERDMLEQIRSLLEGGDTASAVAAMLDTIGDLMDRVDTLNVQLETLLDTLEGEENDGEDFDDTTYIVTCEKCGCVMEVEAWLLEDETAELSCPKCGKEIEM